MYVLWCCKEGIGRRHDVTVGTSKMYWKWSLRRMASIDTDVRGQTEVVSGEVREDNRMQLLQMAAQVCVRTAMQVGRIFSILTACYILDDHLCSCPSELEFEWMNCYKEDESSVAYEYACSPLLLLLYSSVTEQGYVL